MKKVLKSVLLFAFISLLVACEQITTQTDDITGTTTTSVTTVPVTTTTTTVTTAPVTTTTPTTVTTVPVTTTTTVTTAPVTTTTPTTVTTVPVTTTTPTTVTTVPVTTTTPTTVTTAEPPYLLVTGIGFQFSCAIDAYTPWLEGRYLVSSLTLKPGDLIKIVYYFNITSIEDANATMNMVVKSWANNENEIFSENIVPIKDFNLKTGKISITYYARVWENYQSSECIYPMLKFNSGVSGTWDAIAIAKADLDLTARVPGYENLLEHNLDGGPFSVDPAPDLLTTVGFQFSCAIDAYTPWLEGRYLAGSLTLKPGDLIKIVYYFNITSIEDANATMNMVVKSWANKTEIFSENTIPVKDFDFKTGKISITYYARIWENYQSDEWIYPMLWFKSGVSGTWDAIAIAKADLDLTERMPEYENVLEHNLDGGLFSVDPAPDLLTTVGFQFSCATGVATPWLEGRYLVSSLTLKPGDLIKIVYYFNITSIEDANATMNMVVKSWANNENEIFSENIVPIKDFNLKTGKISITYYARVWENYQSSECIYPMLKFNSGVSGTWDAIAIAKADLDLTARVPGYENLLEHNLDGGPFSVDPAPDLLTTVGFQFSCAIDAYTPWLEGRYLAGSLTLKPGDLIKIVYYFNITSIEDANATMNMVVKSWANKTEIFSENTIPVKDFDFKTGKISITYYARIWENYQSDEWIYPMLWFKSGVSGTWDAIAIAKADLDLTERMPEYENVLEHNLDGGLFSVDPAPDLLTTVGFQFSCATGVATPWLEGRYLVSSLTLKPGDLIKIVYYFNITSIEDANATMNMVVKSWANNENEIFSENIVPIKDFNLKTGKISITYYARVWENYQSSECIYPMLKFNSGVSGTWDAIAIAKADLDLTARVPGYENLLEHNLDGGPFSVGE
ncbi:MAG: hypothetical protein ACOX16_01135 [Candidatus Izemoplasmatales bacterium]